MSDLILLSLMLFNLDRDLLVDRIVARIENEVVLLSDLSQRVELLTGKRVEYTENEPKVTKFYQNVLNELIEDRLIHLELKKMGQDVTESEIKATIDDILKQKGLSEEDFKKLLVKEGLSEEKYKEEMRRQIRRNKFIAIKIRPRIKITDEEARLYYNQGFVKERPTYDISMIFISALKERSEKMSPSHRLTSVKEEIALNKDFSEIARSYSDDPSASSGGHLGLVSPGDLREEFERVIFNMKEGEISDELKSAEGYYIFRLNKIVQPEIKDFSESREEIKKMLFEKEMLKQFSSVIDSLKKRYTIYINLK